MSRYARHLKWKQRRNPTQLKVIAKSAEDVRREKEMEKENFEKHKEVSTNIKKYKKPKQSSLGFDSQVKADSIYFIG